MKVALVHNPTAGVGSVSETQIRDSIAAAGHTVASYASTDHPSWEEDVAADVELVVAAGGDGTVRKVFTAGLAPKATITVLALGTSNNVARTLGLPTDDPLRAISRWSAGMVESRYHLPRVTARSFDAHCVEGAGIGIFAELIRRADGAGSGSDDPWQLLRDAITDAPHGEWTTRIDGAEMSGRFLAVAATVVRQTGPNLWLAPKADPSTAQFDVAVVPEAQRTALLEHVELRRRGATVAPFAFEVARGRHVEIEGPHGAPSSVDDVVLAEDDDAPSLVAHSSDRFVRVLVPRERGRFA